MKKMLLSCLFSFVRCLCLVLPIFLGACFWDGMSFGWLKYYLKDFSIFHHVGLVSFLPLWGSIVLFSPIYVLPVTLRFGCFKKPLSCRKKKATVSVTVFLVWVFYVLFVYSLWYQDSLVNWLLDCTTSPLYECMIAFLLAIGLLSTFLVSFIILGYKKSRRWRIARLVVDFTACSVLYAAFVAFCVFFSREGGFIYLRPCSEMYTPAKGFPRDKLKNLKALLRLTAEIDSSLAKTLFFGRVVSYEDFLAIVAASPALFPSSILFLYSSPKFYLRYWRNEVLDSLSNDLVQKDYWGRKWNASSAGWARDAPLASMYMSVLRWSAEGKIEKAYQEWLRDKDGRDSVFYYYRPMTPEENREWLYWYEEKLKSLSRSPSM